MSIFEKLKYKLSAKFIVWGISLAPKPTQLELRKAIIEVVTDLNKLIEEIE
jgi:hypothetical protein